MKLTGKLDAAVWFDMLSILDVKLSKLDCVKDLTKWKTVTYASIEMSEDLKLQIGVDKYFRILMSEEYRNLREANYRVFDAVNKAEDITNISGISAYEVAQLNLLRYRCKQELQTKFFDASMEEVKMREYNAV